MSGKDRGRERDIEDYWGKEGGREEEGTEQGIFFVSRRKGRTRRKVRLQIKGETDLICQSIFLKAVLKEERDKY